MPPSPVAPQPPLVRGSPFAPLALAMGRDPLALLARLQAESGDVVRFTVGGERMLLLAHPDHVREVLVTQQRNFRKGRGLERARLLLGDGLLTSEGEFHLRQRRLAQPAFHRARVAGYALTMARAGERTAAAWRDGETFDVHEQMMHLTLAVVGKTLFDAEVGGDAEAIGAALDEAFASFGLAMLPFGQLLARLPLPPARRFRRARARLDDVVYRIIAERRAAGDADRGDLLSMLMAARDEEDAVADGAGARMSDAQLRDELMTIFLAGHETTANALTWTFHLLAQNEGVEARLHAELDAVLGAPGDGGRAPEPEDVARLPYARQVLAESMRLFPPAWVIGRRAIDDFEVGGYRVAARTVVLMPQWLVHRDPRWYDAPERFDPDRWVPEAAALRHRFAYFPFGAGTRVCIGEQFAWTEGVLLLAAIARRWRLRHVAGERARVTPQPIVTLRPRGGIRMTAEARATR